MEGVAIIKHRSGDLYAYEENSLTGSRGYGPIGSCFETITREFLEMFWADTLSNQTASQMGDLEADGSWLWDEMQAGRAAPVETPDTNYPIATEEATDPLSDLDTIDLSHDLGTRDLTGPFGEEN